MNIVTIQNCYVTNVNLLRSPLDGENVFTI